MLLLWAFSIAGCDYFTEDAGSVSSKDIDSSVEQKESSLPVEESVYEESVESTELSEESEDEEGGVVDSGDYSYILENGVARICAYNGDEDELVVPDMIDGHTVTAIGEKAFYGNSTAKEIHVGDTVANIASLAFANCKSLGVVYIGNSVAVISADCFDNSEKLKGIEVSASNSSFSSVDGVLFTKDKTSLIRCPQSYVAEEYEVSEGVLSVGAGAFKGCNGVESVILPAECTLSPGSFYLCTNLKTVVLPEGLVTVPDRCFFGCALLEEISIPEGVIVIGDYAFFGCVGAREMTLPESISSISESAFHCSNGFEKINVSGEYAENWYENNKDALLASED